LEPQVRAIINHRCVFRPVFLKVFLTFFFTFCSRSLTFMFC
jgi:hypothetical protein